MPKITPEEMLENIDFVCPRCSAECQKINAIEPDLGYISNVDGSFVGPLCQNCWDEIPAKERAMRKVPDTAFLIVIRADGEGAYMTTEGIPVHYVREATPYDAISACNQVVKDLEEALFASKIMQRTAQIVSSSQKTPSKLLVPR